MLWNTEVATAIWVCREVFQQFRYTFQHSNRLFRTALVKADDLNLGQSRLSWNILQILTMKGLESPYFRLTRVFKGFSLSLNILSRRRRPLCLLIHRKYAIPLTFIYN